jgi:hypothetical protein
MLLFFHAGKKLLLQCSSNAALDIAAKKRFVVSGFVSCFNRKATRVVAFLGFFYVAFLPCRKKLLHHCSSNAALDIAAKKRFVDSGFLSCLNRKATRVVAFVGCFYAGKKLLLQCSQNTKAQTPL